MHIFIDHISAFIIAGILFVSLFTMIHRGRQNAVEMQINQIVHEQAYNFLKMVERDLENIRSSSQIISSGINTDCIVTNVAIDSVSTRTLSLIFPTLEVPVDPNQSPRLISVSYQLEAVDSVMVNGSNKQVFRVNRYRQESVSASVEADGTSGPIITNFAVRMFDKDGAESSEDCPDDGELGRTHVAFEAAIPSVEYVDGNQKSTSNLNVTRYGATVYSANR